MKGRCNVVFPLLVASLVAVICFQGCSSLNDEGLALLEFRSKVEVDPHSFFKNWNRIDHNPCRWSGVQCIDGKVASLNLQEQSLGGTLAPELGKLSHLRSLVLYKNNFSGAIPNEFGQLTMLEILDLRGNKLSATVPTEIGIMISLGHLLLCDDNMHCSRPLEETLIRLAELKFDRNLSLNVAMENGCTNRKIKHCAQENASQQLEQSYSFLIPFVRKILKLLGKMPWLKFKNSLSHGHGDTHGVNVPSSPAPYIEKNTHLIIDSARRRLLQESTNLPATPVTESLPQEATEVPSTGSGSYPAVPNSKSGQSADIPDNPNLGSSTSNDIVSNSATQVNSSSSGGLNLKLIGILLGGAVLAILLLAIPIWFGRQNSSAIGPWKTGISGPLQKALVAGVPKLNRLELEAACEEFSNIISTFQNCTIFKGTLSSGVEIAVVSSAVSSKDWSKRSNSYFRKKVDTLSRVNHKNFVNVLGYCEENDPFMRMIVFEYASNGTLHDHLHVKDFDHIDWTARMRIIMGIAYCLQYMHHELSPPVTVSDLNSNAIFLTDDYAAKLSDRSMWKEIADRRKKVEDEDLNPSVSTPVVDTGSTVYGFGLLMLEVISGKVQHAPEEGSILNWATKYLNDKNNFKFLVDLSLKTFKENELEIICEAIQECIHEDSRNKLTMKEITTKLRGELGISPEAACPSLSPLWWAELEILSVEAS